MCSFRMIKLSASDREHKKGLGPTHTRSWAQKVIIAESCSKRGLFAWDVILPKVKVLFTVLSGVPQIA